MRRARAACENACWHDSSAERVKNRANETAFVIGSGPRYKELAVIGAVPVFRTMRRVWTHTRAFNKALRAVSTCHSAQRSLFVTALRE